MNNIKKNILKSYNNFAGFRDKQEIEDWKYREINKFQKHIKLTNKILDLGAGTGIQSKIFNDLNYDITALDFSNEMIDKCNEKGLKTVQRDFYNLNMYEEYDAIWSMNSLVHIPKKDFPTILNNINKALKNNGILYLGLYGGFDNEGVWEGDNYIPKRFFSYYKLEDIKKIIETYFNIIEIEELKFENTNLTYQSFICRKK